MTFGKDYFLDRDIKAGDILYSTLMISGLPTPVRVKRFMIFIGKVIIDHQMFWLIYEYQPSGGLRLNTKICYEPSSTWSDWALIRS